MVSDCQSQQQLAQLEIPGPCDIQGNQGQSPEKQGQDMTNVSGFFLSLVGLGVSSSGPSGRGPIAVFHKLLKSAYANSALFCARSSRSW